MSESSDDDNSVVNVGAQEMASSNVSIKKRRGPKKNHPVWEFFSTQNGQSTCSNCSYQVKGAYPTTLMNHLQSKHPEKYKLVSNKKLKAEKEVAERSRNTENSQAKIFFPVVSAPIYDKDSREKKSIDEALALFTGTTSFAYHLVENDEFIDFVKLLNVRYKLPSRETLKKLVGNVANRICNNIKEMLENCGKVAICADIWTQKNMTAAYLSITAHFYCSKTGQLENVCLAVKQMTTRHTAEVIKKMTDEVLEEFNISSDKVSRFRTDNGSNMVAAFRESLVEITAKIMDNDFADPVEVVDANLDESFDEIAEFDELLTEFHRIFPKLLDCTAHSLQLALKKVIDQNPLLVEIRQDVFALLNKFSKSETATRLLKEKSGKKLITPGLTRWNSLCLTYDCLLEIRNSVDQVCIEKGWSTLGESYATVEVLRDLLKPFLDFTNFLQGEQYPTISGTIPTILNLLMDLELPEPQNRWELLENVPDLLAKELRRRFAHVIGFQEREVGFDSTYLVSTFLDPSTSYLLSSNEQKLAKRELLIMTCKDQEIYSDEIRGCDETQYDGPSSSNSSLISSRFSRLAQIASVSHQREVAAIPIETDEDEAELYLKNFCRSPAVDTLNAIEFWKVHQTEFPRLSSIAFDLLAIPATSAAVERVFSQAGLATLGRKCKTGPALLECECFVKYNKKHYCK